MAQFNEAINKTLKTEGGYVNDPDDRGGETYRGVARNFWSNWSGWKDIDLAKSKDNFPLCLDADEVLQTNIRLFYKHNFWDFVKGDFINDQEIAESIFDFAVNSGRRTSIIMVQKALKVKVDGILGNITLGKINRIEAPKCFLLAFANEKIKRYIRLCKQKKSQKKFFYGWVRRSVV